MALDLAISRAITMVHILERAAHDQGFWSMELCGAHVQANRLVQDDRVVFTAEFPEMGIIEDAIFPLSLYCDDELVLVRMVAFTNRSGDESFLAEWVLTLPLSVAA